MEIPYPVLPEPQAYEVVTKPTVKTTVIKPGKPTVKTTTGQTVKPVKTKKTDKDIEAEGAVLFLAIGFMVIIVLVVCYLIIRRR